DHGDNNNPTRYNNVDLPRPDRPVTAVTAPDSNTASNPSMIGSARRYPNDRPSTTTDTSSAPRQRITERQQHHVAHLDPRHDRQRIRGLHHLHRNRLTRHQRNRHPTTGIGHQRRRRVSRFRWRSEEHTSEHQSRE